MWPFGCFTNEEVSKAPFKSKIFYDCHYDECVTDPEDSNMVDLDLSFQITQDDTTTE